MPKGIPKRMNSDNIEIKIYWPKLMFDFFLRIKIDYLRPLLLIHAFYNGIEIRQYLLCYKNKFKVNV